MCLNLRSSVLFCIFRRFSCTERLTSGPHQPAGGPIVSATEALSPATIPPRLVVVGAGYIGLELGIVYRKLGSQVTVVEAMDRPLPTYDEELTRPVAASLQHLDGRRRGGGVSNRAVTRGHPAPAAGCGRVGLGGAHARGRRRRRGR